MLGAASPLLAVEGVTKRFGGLSAVDGVSFTLEAGLILGLIGPNGSGKTTLLNILNGVHKPDAGTILMRGASLGGMRTYAFAHRGVMRTFQNPHVFSTITALENMLVPTLHMPKSGKDLGELADSLLEFVGLQDKRDLPASELSGGQQKLLEFARALMTDPQLVLMDEPFAGVHPAIKALMLDRIRERNSQGTTFIIVSHEIPDLMELCRRIVCLNRGALIADGTPDEVRENEQVVEAYLGHPGSGGAA